MQMREMTYMESTLYERYPEVDAWLPVPGTGNVFKRAFYQLKIVLISRVHGLIHFFFIVCTKELYGFVDFWHDACWCERERLKRQPSGGWRSQTGEATARSWAVASLGVNTPGGMSACT